MVTTPFVRPLGIYLAPVPSNPQNKVDVWMHSNPWHSRPLVRVVQSAGSFSRSFDEADDMQLKGCIKLGSF